jgi:hypothetical protein
MYILLSASVVLERLETFFQWDLRMWLRGHQRAEAAGLSVGRQVLKLELGLRDVLLLGYVRARLYDGLRCGQ